MNPAHMEPLGHTQALLAPAHLPTIPLRPPGGTYSPCSHFTDGETEATATHLPCRPLLAEGMAE